MRLFEFESKRIFKAEGIPVPRGEVVSSSKEAKRAASKISALLEAGIPVAEKPSEITGVLKQIL